MKPAHRKTLSLARAGALSALMLAMFAAGSAMAAKGPDGKLGSVRNEVAASLVPGTTYHNIVNIGCGWASGVNFVASYDWPSVLGQILADPANVYAILTDPANQTSYANRYALLIKQALEARDGHTINLFDVSETGHTSPYGQFEIDRLDERIQSEYGGQLSGNTLVLYEFGPPDFVRLVGMAFDRDPALNPIATLNGGEPMPLGAALYGDSYWQARLAAALGVAPATLITTVVERYLGHFLPTQSGATPYVDETDLLGPPNTNDLTVSDRFFASYAKDYDRLLANQGGRYGAKVDIIAVGNEDAYEGGPNFRQYAASVIANPNVAFVCGLFTTFLGCDPTTLETNGGIDPDFVHPYADMLPELARDYHERMAEQAREKGVSLINAIDLFAGHSSRFDDPTSPDYVEDDPTYWTYVGEINALGHEVVADVMLHILETGKANYRRRHSDTFRAQAIANEFPGVYGY